MQKSESLTFAPTPSPPPKNAVAPVSGPLGRHSSAEIKYLLRGFPERSIAGALALRLGARVADYEACLFGILVFYGPPGTDAPDGVPSGGMRLHEDLGLDSMSLFEAMFKIEDLFDISIDNAELTDLVTIADARRLLIQKLGPSPSSEPARGISGSDEEATTAAQR